MYLPKTLHETRPEVMHDLMRSHPLGTWVITDPEELNVNHIPFLIDDSQGEFGILYGHVARSNPVWESSAAAVPNVVVFRGPQTYISPSWYPSKHEHGKAVPTWNYAIVAAHGKPTFIEDGDWLLEHLRAMTDIHERSQALPWNVEDAPRDFIDRMVKAIVGVEIPISKLEGKWKTNQNRPAGDKLGVVAGLITRGDEEAAAMASLVQKHVSP